MLRFILKRILQIIPTLFVVVFIVFVITRIIPGDPAAVMLGPQATVEAINELREELGLNDSIIKQFGYYLKDILKGDLGKSYYYNESVMKLIAEHFPNTLILALTSIIIGLIVGIPVGVISATKQYSAFDYISMVIALIGISMPIFWLGMMLVLLFSVNLRWLPSVGMGYGGFVDAVKHLILPSICLATGPTAVFARFTRSSMLDIIKEDYVKTARAKGLKENIVVWKHAFKNALPPIITIVGMRFSAALSGAVLTETIFSWPGLGKLIVDSIQNRDYTLVQGSVIYLAFIYMFVNLIVDIGYGLLNPKVKASLQGIEGGE